MPGLQILNARLSEIRRVSAVPWYTASFSVGTATSFLFMGFMMINSSYISAAILNIFLLLISGLVVFIAVHPQKVKLPPGRALRSPRRSYPPLG